MSALSSPAPLLERWLVLTADTRLRKTGRSIPQAAWTRHPLSPPFHTNLMLGLRFLQASLLVPLHRAGPFSAPGLPIRFEEVSTVKKPGRRSLATLQTGPQTLPSLAALRRNHGPIA